MKNAYDKQSEGVNENERMSQNTSDFSTPHKRREKETSQITITGNQSPATRPLIHGALSHHKFVANE